MKKAYDADDKNQYDTASWYAILEEADQLACLHEKSGHLDRGKARPRFSIRFPPKTEPTLHTVLKFEMKESSETELAHSAQEIQHKFSASSMTELLEKLTKKAQHHPMVLTAKERRERPKKEQPEFMTPLDPPTMKMQGASGVKGQTMAGLFQEIFTVSAADVEGLPLSTRAATGYYGRLQQIMQRDKDRHMKFVKQLHNQSRGIDVKILSRVLDAKSIVCRCLFCGKITECIESSQTGNNRQMPEEIGETTERIIIFSSKICGNVELEVGNLICIYPPWKEVQIREDDIIILCTYFSQIVR
ncbi:unnamed protein product [Spirodela intermedia]|uniref:Uncharacterized protein n=1 Tax=Spirodela intermedia TaxID=51605 RepID=A0A7I8JMM2_SPIIN|nr:unnamed protein product [Spirodela intermedia]CAA6671417.1 unnamed protein product [Spirodela intermedia]